MIEVPSPGGHWVGDGDGDGACFLWVHVAGAFECVVPGWNWLRSSGHTLCSGTAYSQCVHVGVD